MKNMKNESKTPRVPKLWEALVTMVILVELMAVAI